MAKKKTVSAPKASKDLDIMAIVLFLSIALFSGIIGYIIGQASVFAKI